MAEHDDSSSPQPEAEPKAEAEPQPQGQRSSTYDMKNLNIGGRLTEFFIDSKLTILLIMVTMVFGILALFITPREENPQISVPSANVIIIYPGASAGEVEKVVSDPLERLLWKINGVEHVYSASMPGMAVVTVRFHVGQPLEDSMFKVYNQVYSNLEQSPKGVLHPLIKPVDIDEVPIVAFTLYSQSLSDYELRQEAQRIIGKLREVRGSSDAVIVGGQKRQITVEIDPVRIAASGIDLPQVVQALQVANQELPAGDVEREGRKYFVQAGQFFQDAKELETLIVGVNQESPVYLRDVAQVTDGPGERTTLTRISFGPAAESHEAHFMGEGQQPGTSFQMVTIALAKKKGQNAVIIANDLVKKMQSIASTALSPGVKWVVTRNDGERANDAVNELVHHLMWAIVIIIILSVVSLGLRDAAVIAVALILTLLATLGIGLLFGQTINRITLFALILALGLLVDDSIVVVENIHRHLSMTSCPRKNACVGAVNEISAPTIYATLAVMVSMIPMAFVTGMMGPYMAPIPFNVPVSMFISLLVAFKITPYLGSRWLKVHPHASSDDLKKGWFYRIYQKLITPFLSSPALRRLLYLALAIILLIMLSFPLLQWVKFRMLPKANTNTFLVTIDMPEGTVLGRTDELARKAAELILAQPEVKDVETFVGTGSIVDFNGLLRGTSFRNATHFADLRVNLIHKHYRKARSEDVVARLRPMLHNLRCQMDANIKLVEDPPGPPVRSTLVAELFGSYGPEQRRLAGTIEDEFRKVKEVVDVDSTVKVTPGKYVVRADKVKAHLAGIPFQQIVQTLSGMMQGYPVTTLHLCNEEEQVPVVLRYPLQDRLAIDDLKKVTLTSMKGGKVPLSELITISREKVDATIYHKNLRPVTYVFGEMGKRSSVYAMIDLLMWQSRQKLPRGYDLEWEGEWDLTLKVFRDLGIAMGIAVLLIYFIMVSRFKSFKEPLVIMGAVPLTMLGILPGFAILGASGIYFSATGMIGVIALSGIVVRNSIILIEFIADQKEAGLTMEEAIVEAGSVRARPIVLTAAAAMSGMFVIAADPVWSGLAWAIIFGVVASTSLSLGVIPLLYYSVKAGDWKKA
ncbi:MAG: efflux RND transporter permease subunit [Candidatus Eremiobacteraeota bacterium]|nr:efflux RND transporter permease subunit [Candidatus Eremiobacteraeota bacterium]